MRHKGKADIRTGKACSASAPSPARMPVRRHLIGGKALVQLGVMGVLRRFCGPRRSHRTCSRPQCPAYPPARPPARAPKPAVPPWCSSPGWQSAAFRGSAPGKIPAGRKLPLMQALIQEFPRHTTPGKHPHPPGGNPRPGQ